MHVIANVIETGPFYIGLMLFIGTLLLIHVCCFEGHTYNPLKTNYVKFIGLMLIILMLNTSIGGIIIDHQTSSYNHHMLSNKLDRSNHKYADSSDADVSKITTKRHQLQKMDQTNVDVAKTYHYVNPLMNKIGITIVAIDLVLMVWMIYVANRKKFE